MPHPFIEFLQAKQRAMGLSDSQFARDVLLVSPATWSQVQSNGRGVGQKVIDGAFRAFTNAEDQLALARARSVPAPRVPRPPELPGRVHSSAMRRGLQALTNSSSGQPETAAAP